MNTLSQKDAEELAARRAHDAKLTAKYHGWKPLVIWYALWATLFGVGAISSLAAGKVGVCVVGIVLCALCLKYAHYLYNGGRRRVWFVIF